MASARKTRKRHNIMLSRLSSQDGCQVGIEENGVQLNIWEKYNRGAAVQEKKTDTNLM